MAASRYEQNEEFFVRMFNSPDMMRQIMDTLGAALYETLKRSVDYSDESTLRKVAEDIKFGGIKCYDCRQI